MFGAISATSLLEIWERGYSRSPLSQGLLLLSLAWPDRSIESLKLISIGDRDRVLWILRQQLFGSTVQSLSVCPTCGHSWEIECDLSQAFEAESTTDIRLDYISQDRLLTLRLPNSADLLQIAQGGEAESNATRRGLLQACLIHPEDAEAIQKLSDGQVDELSGRMADADPNSNLALGLECDRCQTAWQLPFDIVSFLWAEVDRVCRRLMVEVHRLAVAYGWQEREILNLTPWRRHLYLEMVRG